MCGEHGTPFSSSLSLMGSSPHVRGAQPVVRAEHIVGGIIPACAGSTPRNLLLVSAPWDHPRMCGEHATPRTDTPDSTGIIPACAGSTSVCFLGKFLVGDHPRMCGEHRSGFNALFFLTGSSPHVRGARKDSPLRRCHSGIIPACAGSTLTLAVSRSRARDHPRMCGEHPIQGKPARVGTGSSPHVRGALAQRHGTIVASGIIPACAGSTHGIHARSENFGDHPRMCGEHTSKIA